MTVRDLPGFSERVSLQAPASDVAQLFERSPDLVGAIVVDESASPICEVVGVVSRAAFLERLSHPFALELFMKRPISSELELDRRRMIATPKNLPTMF